MIEASTERDLPEIRALLERLPVWRTLCRTTGPCAGGAMFFKTAPLLIVWLLGMFGVYRVGNLAHVFLLVGLMLLLLAVLKGRKAALERSESRNNR